jgi:hypothetical protein
MTWKERLRSKLLFRNLLTDVMVFLLQWAERPLPHIFNIKSASVSLTIFCISLEQPNLVRYTNDIFNKLFE